MSSGTWYLTPSGSAIALTPRNVDRHPNRALRRYWFDVRTSSAKFPVYVGLTEPSIVSTQLEQQLGAPPQDIMPELAALAILRSIDGTLQEDEDGTRYIGLDPSSFVSLWSPPKAADRDVRRFMARRVYDSYSRGTLSDPCSFPPLDLRLLGISEIDLLRNAQLLEAEGYWQILSSLEGELMVVPTAKLVRDVEQYGAPKADAVVSRDYLAAVRAYTGLSAHADTIALEYNRYSVAATDVELASVFKATAPVVEAVVNAVLAANGSGQQHSTLGPAINDMRSRGIGGVGLWSQLDHVLKFPRNLAQHGANLPGSVLRIACETCFELLPQLGALFPDQ